jgi:hypothetical protein
MVKAIERVVVGALAMTALVGFVIIVGAMVVGQMNYNLVASIGF